MYNKINILTNNLIDNYIASTSKKEIEKKKLSPSDFLLFRQEAINELENGIIDTDDTAFNNIEKSSDIKPTKSNSNKSSKKSLIKTNEVVINKKNINDVITTDNIENTNTVEDMEEIETDDNDLLSILKSVKG
ncbi:MAG: hypothetical protein ACLT4F_07525 [Clostridia bacterium]